MKDKQTTPTDFLSLSRNEVTIFNLLKAEAFSTPALLSRYCNIPRPTVYITLEKLSDRGLVQKRTVAGKSVWKVSSTQAITEAFERSKALLLGSKANIRKINLNTNTDIVVHRGKDTILEIFSNLIHKHGGNRLVGIQGDYAGDAWKDSFEIDDINTINTQITKQGLITEIITSRKWFKRQVDIFGKSWAENFLGRTAQIHFIDNVYLDYKSQIFIFGNQTYLVSMEDEVFIEIKNKEISKLIVSLMRYIEDSSPSVNITKILSELITTGNPKSE